MPNLDTVNDSLGLVALYAIRGKTDTKTVTQKHRNNKINLFHNSEISILTIVLVNTFEQEVLGGIVVRIIILIFALLKVL